MKTPCQELSEGVCQSQAAARIRVVIIYENRAAALRARKAMDHVALAIQNDFQFELSAWSFAMFRLAALQEVVFHDAEHADLVVISVDANATIPSEVMSAVTQWCGLKGDRQVALALLANAGENESTGFSALRAQLELIAERSSVDLISGDGLLRDDALERDLHTFNQVAPRRMAVESLAEPTHVDERWGLND